jgi:predicted PP-loop superfamily ATPase
MKRGIEPKVCSIQESPEGGLIVTVSDRAEKSLFLGPGGRVISEMVNRLGRNIAVYSEEEMIVRASRLAQTERRLNEVSRQSKTLIDFFDQFTHAFTNERNLIHGHVSYRIKNTGLEVPVAFSGGVDSGASLVILQMWGFEPHAVTIDLGREFHTPDEMNAVTDWTKARGFKHTVISGSEEVSTTYERVSLGLIHPCGNCHQVTMNLVKDWVKENGYAVMVTGEMLPSGRQSIVIENNLVIIHLPAALTLNKYNTRTISSMSGLAPGKYFGCRLVSQHHSQGWKAIRPSIHRVLRELDAGILTTGQAMDLIKDVLRPALKQKE